MQLAVTGREIGKMEADGELVPVYVIGKSEQLRRDEILNHIAKENGESVPLAQLGHFERRSRSSMVKRRNDRRYLVIEGQADSNLADPQEINKSVSALLDKLKLPSSTTVVFGGDSAEIAESLNSMGRASLLALGLCYFLLVLLCKSYLQPVFY